MTVIWKWFDNICIWNCKLTSIVSFIFFRRKTETIPQGSKLVAKSLAEAISPNSSFPYPWVMEHRECIVGASQLAGQHIHKPLVSTWKSLLVWEKAFCCPRDDWSHVHSWRLNRPQDVAVTTFCHYSKSVINRSDQKPLLLHKPSCFSYPPPTECSTLIVF